MVTRSEAYKRTYEAWSGEPCPGCGTFMTVSAWADDGSVYAYCDRCDREFWVAREEWPAQLEPEPPGADDLPF